MWLKNFHNPRLKVKIVFRMQFNDVPFINTFLHTDVDPLYIVGRLSPLHLVYEFWFTSIETPSILKTLWITDSFELDWKTVGVLLGKGARTAVITLQTNDQLLQLSRRKVFNYWSVWREKTKLSGRFIVSGAAGRASFGK